MATLFNCCLQLTWIFTSVFCLLTMSCYSIYSKMLHLSSYPYHSCWSLDLFSCLLLLPNSFPRCPPMLFVRLFSSTPGFAPAHNVYHVWSTLSFLLYIVCFAPLRLLVCLNISILLIKLNNICCCWISSQELIFRYICNTDLHWK